MTRSRRHGLAARTLWLTLLVLLPVVALEIGARALVATGRIAEGPSHEQDLDARWRRAMGGDTPDIIVLGDSLTAQGIDPSVIANRVSAALPGTPDLRAQSLASPGGSFGLGADLLHKLEQVGRLPRVIVMGVSEAMLENPGGSQRSFGETPMGRSIHGCAMHTTIESRVDCELGAFSVAWRWHGRPAEAIRAIRGRDGRDLDADGLRPSRAMSEGRFMQVLPSALRLADPTVVLTADARQGAEDLARTADRLGIPVVMVAIPFSPPYQEALEERQAGWEASRRAAVAELEALTGITVADPYRFGDWWSFESARDPRHLSGEGARDFTRQVMEMPEVLDALVAALGATPGS
ncbi:MAG: hypothetical protein KF809_07015 [Chloroflexi bacterium]|nr:hypothetical protein [Chloroflexota bacterium]